MPSDHVRRSDADLSDVAGFWTRPLDERAAVFAELRARPTLAFFDEPESPFEAKHPGFYAVTRHEHIAEASRNPEVFTSSAGATGIPDMPEELLDLGRTLLDMDDPRHARMRRIVSRGFTPKRIAALQETVDRIASDVVSRALETGRQNGGRCDVVADVTARLPLQIICTMMGIPESQYDLVFGHSNTLAGLQDPDYVPEGEDLLTAMLNAVFGLREVMNTLGAERREHPADDLVSVLVNAEIDGEKLTLDELGSFFVLLVAAGSDTTRNALSWGIKAMSDHPDQRAEWAADPDGLARTAVEEILRWSSPVIFMRRTVAAPYVLGGTELAPGDKVALFYWSANRDESRFVDPHVFDIHRDPNPHFAFGGSGPHFCLGAHLARRQIGALFGELLRRVPDLHVTGEPERLTSMFINGVKRMSAEFSLT